MKLPQFAVQNYQFTILFFVLLSVFGITSYLDMPQSENPTVYIPGGSVVVIYPGANPSDLEQLVASPLEEAINELDDIKKIETTLTEGLAVINVEFIYETDAQEKYDEVIQKVNATKSELPDDILSIRTNQWTSTDVAMLQLALVSDSAEYSLLESHAEKIKSRVERLSGIKKVEIHAYPEREVRISLDLEKMAQMNIGIGQIEKAIQSNNANIPGGSIDLSGQNFSIKTSGSYKQLSEIRNTVVHSYAGRIIYLRNIATVSFDYEDLNYKARFNKNRAIFITINQKEGLNVFDIKDHLEPVIQSYKNELDKGITLEYVFDQTLTIEDRVEGFIINLLQGIVLVGLVILLALGLKSSLIVSIAIPLSIVIGLGFVDLAGLGLQQITIAGLVVALGLLVDNSIVMVENINRFISMGYSSKEAAIKGASQIGRAIVSATITTLLAFVPIIMMPDKAGDFIKGLPVTIIATLSISLLIALTLTPLVTSRIFKAFSSQEEAQKYAKKKKGIEKSLQKLIEGPYRLSLAFALRHPMLVIVLAVAVLGISVFVFQYVGVSFFPKAETPQFMVRVNMPEGAGLARTDKATQYVENVLDTTREVKHFAANIGHGNPRIYYNIFPKKFAKNFADIYVETHEYEPQQFKRLISRLRDVFDKYPGAKINIKEFEQGVPMQAPIMLYVSGNDVDVLRRIASDAEEMLKKMPGAINIENQLEKQRIDIRFDINKDKAGMLGVPVYRIDKTIRTAITGTTISKFRDSEGKEYNIVLRLPDGENVNIEDFDKIYVASLSGRLIPLRQLAHIELETSQSVITRNSLVRTALITGDLESGSTLDEVINPVIKQLKNYSFPKGYDYWFGGELEARTETFGGMRQAIIIALIAIFAVLVLQFHSFAQPLIIFAAIPLALIGSIWALLLAGYTFSFTAFIGLISLVGIVINNSIILVDYSNQLRAGGKSPEEAIVISGETRFTPIILTTLTTVGGLFPLTLQGGTLWAPMGWTIIGGLLASTVLTLIIVPVLYKIFTKVEILAENHKKKSK